jgi:hypothetical protein
VPQAATTETLTYERRRRRRWLLWVVTMVLLVAGGSYWVLDGQRRDGERLALTRCVEDARGAVERAERGLNTFYRYIAPAVDPLRVESPAGIYVLLSRDAVKSRPLVQRSLARCRSVDVWWLHADLRRARNAYVALLYAELDRLERVIYDGMAYLGGSEAIRRLSDEAERAWRHRVE